MWEFRLKPSGVKWLVLIWVFQIWIGNIAICNGRHIKLHGTVTGDSVIVEAPEESQTQDASSFRRNLLRKNENQNQHNQNQYSDSSSLSAGLTSSPSQMEMHLKEPGSSSRQHNFFGDDHDLNDRRDDKIQDEADEDHHSYHERYIGNSNGDGNQDNQFKDQQQQGNYKTDEEETELGRHSLVNSYFDNEYSLRMLYSMECITPTKSKGYCSTFRSCVPSLFTSDGELEAPALAELISFSIGYCTMDVSGGSSNILMKRAGNRFSAVANRIICCPGSPPKSGIVSAESSAEKFNDFLQGTGPKVSIFEDDEHKQPLSSSISASTSEDNHKPTLQQLQSENASPGQVQDQSVQQQSEEEAIKGHYSDEPSIVSDETLSVPISKIPNEKAQSSQSQGSAETTEGSSSELGNIEGQNNKPFKNHDKTVEEKPQTIPIEAFIPPEKFDTYDPQTNKFSDQLLTTLDGNNNDGPFVGSGGGSHAAGQDSTYLHDGHDNTGNIDMVSEINEISQTSETITTNSGSAESLVDNESETNKNYESTPSKISESSEIVKDESENLVVKDGSETIQNPDKEMQNGNETENLEKISSDQSDNSTIIKISPEPVKGANGKFTLDKGVIIEKATSETPRPKPNPAFQTQIGETTVNIIKPDVTIDSNAVLITPQKNSENSNQLPVHLNENENSDEILDADVVQLSTFSSKIPALSVPIDDNNDEIAHSDEDHHEVGDMDDEDSSGLSGSSDFIPTTTFKTQSNQQSDEGLNDFVERTTIPSDDLLTTTVQYFKGKDTDKFVHDENNDIQIPTTPENFVSEMTTSLPAGLNNDEGVTHLQSQEDEQTTTSRYVSPNLENAFNDNPEKEESAASTLQPSSIAQDDESISYTTKLNGNLSNDTDSEFSTTFATYQISNQNDLSESEKKFLKNTLPNQNNEQPQINSDEIFPGNSLEQTQRFPIKEPSSYELQSVDDSAESPQHFSSIAGQKYVPKKPITIPISGGVQRPTLSSPLFPGNAAKLPPQVHEDDSLENEHNLPYPPSQHGWTIGQLYHDQSKNNKTTLPLETDLTKPINPEMHVESGVLSNTLQTGNTDATNHIEESNSEKPAEDVIDSSELESGSSESSESSQEKEPEMEKDISHFETGQLSFPDSIRPEPTINEETSDSSEVNSSADFPGSQGSVMKQNYPGSVAQHSDPLADFPGSQGSVLKQNYPGSVAQHSDPLADFPGSQGSVLKQNYPGSAAQQIEETSSRASVEQPQVVPTISVPTVVTTEVTSGPSFPASSSESFPSSPMGSFPSSPAESFPSSPAVVAPSTGNKPSMPGSAEVGGLNPQDHEDESQPEYQILSACATQDYYRSLEQDSLHQYPFLATIVGGSRPFCSGTLITDRHILTAAHFLSNITVSDVFHMRVHVGYRTAYGGQTEGPYAVRKVIKVIRHKGFSFDKLVNDIAILVLDRPIRFSEDVHPVCLSNSPQLYTDGNTEAFETGWMEDPLTQKISPLHPFIDPHILKYFTFGYENVTWALHEAKTRIRTNDECQANYGFLEKSGISITDSMVCAASISEGKSCSFKGNSGAGLIVINDGKPIQVGLVSWGIGCGHFEAVFTRIASFLPWIEKVVYRTS